MICIVAMEKSNYPDPFDFDLFDLFYIAAVPIKVALKTIQLKRRFANAVMLSRINH